MGNVNNRTAAGIVIENIMTRATVRSFTGEGVSEDDTEILLKAGMAAPSALNRQPWHFIVVTDRGVLRRISELTPNARMASDAPLAIIVCGDLSKALEGEEQGFWIQDASAATENILLAAHALGLGAVWTGTFPIMERCERIRQLLMLKEELVPLNTIVIGHPAEKIVAKDKYKEGNVSYNVYGRKDGAQ